MALEQHLTAGDPVIRQAQAALASQISEWREKKRSGVVGIQIHFQNGTVTIIKPNSEYTIKAT